ncbi:MAG: hypothetical protein ACKV2Q_33105 [Planctomycetaceae bacterium]
MNTRKLISRSHLLTLVTAFFCCINGCGTGTPVSPEDEVTVFLRMALDAWSQGLTESQFNESQKEKGMWIYDGDWYHGAVLLEYEIKGVREDQELARYLLSTKGKPGVDFMGDGKVRGTIGDTLLPESKVLILTVVLTFQSRGGTPIKERHTYSALRMRGEEGRPLPGSREHWQVSTIVPKVPERD